MTKSSDADRAALDARIESARIHRPALYAFVSKVRAGIVPSMIEAGAMLREAGADRDEARSICARWSEPEDDGFARFMAQLRAFDLRS